MASIESVGAAMTREHPDPRTPGEFQISLEQDFDASDYSVRATAASNVAILYKLSRDVDFQIRHYVAINASTSAEILDYLGRDLDDEELLIAVANHPNTSFDILRKLAHDPRSTIRSTVARRTNISMDLLAELALDIDEHVRWLVACQYANSSVTLLFQFASDSSQIVRSQVAQYAATPSELLSKLARDSSITVRRAVAGNMATPAELLAELTQTLNGRFGGRW